MYSENGTTKWVFEMVLSRILKGSLIILELVFLESCSMGHSSENDISKAQPDIISGVSRVWPSGEINHYNSVSTQGPQIMIAGTDGLSQFHEDSLKNVFVEPDNVFDLKWREDQYTGLIYHSSPARVSLVTSKDGLVWEEWDIDENYHGNIYRIGNRLGFFSETTIRGELSWYMEENGSWHSFQTPFTRDWGSGANSTSRLENRILVIAPRPEENLYADQFTAYSTTDFESWDSLSMQFSEEVANPKWMVKGANAFLLVAEIDTTIGNQIDTMSRVFKSSDFKKWEKISFNPMGTIEQLSYLKGKFVITSTRMCDTCSQKMHLNISTSTDGIQWDVTELVLDTWYRNYVRATADFFFYPPEGGNGGYYSLNGVEWKSYPLEIMDKQVRAFDKMSDGSYLFVGDYNLLGKFYPEKDSAEVLRAIDTEYHQVFNFKGGYLASAEKANGKNYSVYSSNGLDWKEFEIPKGGSSWFQCNLNVCIAGNYYTNNGRSWVKLDSNLMGRQFYYTDQEFFAYYPEGGGDYTRGWKSANGKDWIDLGKCEFYGWGRPAKSFKDVLFVDQYWSSDGIHWQRFVIQDSLDIYPEGVWQLNNAYYAYENNTVYKSIDFKHWSKVKQTWMEEEFLQRIGVGSRTTLLNDSISVQNSDWTISIINEKTGIWESSLIGPYLNANAHQFHFEKDFAIAPDGILVARSREILKIQLDY